MQKKKKRIFAVLLSAILVVALTGCSKLGSIINEIHGSLIGNNYTVYTYDNYGNQTLKTSGKKISITGNKIETVSYDSDGRAVTGYDLSSVITITIDGNDFEQIAKAFEEARATKGMPTAIIAKTVKGKGVSFMENAVNWHGVAPNDEQFEIAMRELEKAGEALCQK